MEDTIRLSFVSKGVIVYSVSDYFHLFQRMPHLYFMSRFFFKEILSFSSHNFFFFQGTVYLKIFMFEEMVPGHISLQKVYLSIRRNN